MSVVEVEDGPRFARGSWLAAFGVVDSDGLVCDIGGTIRQFDGVEARHPGALVLPMTQLGYAQAANVFFQGSKRFEGAVDHRQSRVLHGGIEAWCGVAKCGVLGVSAVRGGEIDGVRSEDGEW